MYEFVFICYEEEFIWIICIFKWILSICRINDKLLYWLILIFFLFWSILIFLGWIYYFLLFFIGLIVWIWFWYYIIKIYWFGNRFWKVFLIKMVKFDIDFFICKSILNYWDVLWVVLKWKFFLLVDFFCFL